MKLKITVLLKLSFLITDSERTGTELNKIVKTNLKKEFKIDISTSLILRQVKHCTKGHW